MSLVFCVVSSRIAPTTHPTIDPSHARARCSRQVIELNTVLVQDLPDTEKIQNAFKLVSAGRKQYVLGTLLALDIA